ncbi:MAG: hypothetical protein ABIO05_02225, partial [Ferruginibacter sp.]
MASSDLHNEIFGELPEASAKSKLQDVVNTFPYYAPAHFYLLKNTAIDDSEYNSTAAATSLHFNNPFYLNFLLNEKELPVSENVKEGMPEDNTVITPELILQSDKHNLSENADSTIKDQTQILVPHEDGGTTLTNIQAKD